MEATQATGDQIKTIDPRSLTEEEKNKLDGQKVTLSNFQQEKLMKERAKNWDRFYNRNETRFFKDRHWTLREFSDLANLPNSGDKPWILMEIGCGVGNFMFPFLTDLKSFRCSSSTQRDEDVSEFQEPSPHGVYVIGCDFSPKAVQQVMRHPQYDIGTCTTRVLDITDPHIPQIMFQWAHSSLNSSVNDIKHESDVGDILPGWLAEKWIQDYPNGCVDIVTLIFVLSALQPSTVDTALTNVFHLLKPGGRVLIRDYGLHDHAQIRFSSRGSKLGERFYTRQDGTFSYFFALNELSEMLNNAGFHVIQQCYVHRPTTNRRENLCVTRVFVQIVAEKR